MLIQFNFSNYKSFKDENSFDLSALRLGEHQEHIRDISGEKILPCSVLFGANASRKSNFLNALLTMRRFALGEEVLFGNSAFEVYFSGTDERIYHYGFSLKDGCVVEEWLNLEESERIFYRKNDEIDLAKFTNKEKKRIVKDLDEKSLIVQEDLPYLEEVFFFFKNIKFVMADKRLISKFRVHIC